MAKIIYLRKLLQGSKLPLVATQRIFGMILMGSKIDRSLATIYLQVPDLALQIPKRAKENVGEFRSGNC